jgi:hypothetical protein
VHCDGFAAEDFCLQEMNMKASEVYKVAKNAFGVVCDELCLCVFQEVVDNLVAEYMPVEGKGQKKPANQQEASRGTRGYSSWFYWRRTSEPKKISADLSTSEVSSPESEKLSDVKEVIICLVMLWKMWAQLRNIS